MEAISSIHTIIKIAAEFGLVGVVLVMWWMDSNRIRKILDSYKEDMGEMRQMYKNNVHLVESNEDLAKDLKDVVIMNTQAWQKSLDAINGNQFCPRVRLEKKAGGIVE